MSPQKSIDRGDLVIELRLPVIESKKHQHHAIQKNFIGFRGNFS